MIWYWQGRSRSQSPRQNRPETTNSAPRSSKESNDGKQFWRNVNDIAFQNLSAGCRNSAAPPSTSRTPARGGYLRKLWGRELEEDLSIHPDGVTDFGVWDIGDARQGKRTAIDIVIEYGLKRERPSGALAVRTLRCRSRLARLARANGAEAARSAKPAARPSAGAGPGLAAKGHGGPIFELFWHGKAYNRELRSWLVEEMIPETGLGLASGQWGTAKTLPCSTLPRRS